MAPGVIIDDSRSDSDLSPDYSCENPLTPASGSDDGTGASPPSAAFTPIAICGMSCRLPGGINNTQGLFPFLLAGGDARGVVPETRYNIEAYHDPTPKKPGTIVSKHGYFLDESVDLGALDTSFFSMPKAELERVDPQHRLLLEVSREAFDDAGVTDFRGKNIGVYVGSYGQDWHELFNTDRQRYGGYQVTVVTDFALSNRLSYEMDLQGPSMTIRTACSASLVGLNEACLALARGDCESALVAGTNLLLGPDLTMVMSNMGVMSPDGSCKPFSANVNGYARAEAIVSFMLKPLADAIRDNNPIRAVITGAATNHDGKTNGITVPNADAQEALIRRAYQVAGISEKDYCQTGFVECHGTGTPTGDPLETEAVARVFGEKGVLIGSVKGNLGHSEGASGMTSLLKAVLCLENRMIPPNIKSQPPNPKIRWDKGLVVPQEPTPWPKDRHERVSINSFGIGGSNAHVIVESAASYGVEALRREAAGLKDQKTERVARNTPRLLLYSANSPESLKKMAQQYTAFAEANPNKLSDLAYTLANHREHLPHRSFAVATPESSGMAAAPTPPPKGGQTPNLVMVFTGQGAQWPQMGRELIKANTTFRDTIRSLDAHLSTLAPAGVFKLEEELLKPARTSRINEAELSQPLCTAIQIALVDSLASVGVTPAAVVGHSSGEIAAAYAAGAITAKSAIAIAYHRGAMAKLATGKGAMAAVGMGWEDAERFLVPGVVIACDNSPKSVTLSGDSDKLEAVVAYIKLRDSGVLATMLKVDKAYHSHHMVEIGQQYLDAMVKSGVTAQAPTKPFYSSVSGGLLSSNVTTKLGAQLGPRYWQRNLEQAVLFKSAVTAIIQEGGVPNPVFLELGPHGALAGPVRQTLAEKGLSAVHVSALTRRTDSMETYLNALGKLYSLHIPFDPKALVPTGSCLPDLPTYPWKHSRSYWFESRVTKAWRLREHKQHPLLGARVPESSDLEPIWRNIFHLDSVPWVGDHKVNDDIVFPFAGYVGMAAEAARQMTGISYGVSLRRVLVSAALLIEDNKPTELITTLRPQRLTDSLNSQWFEFSISSHNGHAWTKHCSGEVRAETASIPEPPRSPGLPQRRVNARKWYEIVRNGGLNYGYHFTTLQDIRASTVDELTATAHVSNSSWHGDEADYHVHPVILDSYLQLLGCAAHRGRGENYRQCLPTSFSSLTMMKCPPGEGDIDIRALVNSTNEGILGHGLCSSGSRAVIRVEGMRMSRLDENTDDRERSVMPITARSEWVRHVDFEDVKGLVKGAHPHEAYFQQLNELAHLATTLLKRVAAQATTGTDCPESLSKYLSWLQSYESARYESLKDDGITVELQRLIQDLKQTPASVASELIANVVANFPAIIAGTSRARDVLDVDSALSRLSAFTRAFDADALLRCMALGKPSLKILELDASSSSAASKLKLLTRADGQVMYSRYVVAQPSGTALEKAKERLKDFQGIEFVQLDIGKGLDTQGFDDQEGEFDVVIAAGVLHGTPSLSSSLSRIHKLLSPNGRLVLQEPVPDLAWTKLVLGLLAPWWAGATDDRLQEPYVTPERWHDELSQAGFGSSPDNVVLDADNGCHMNAIIVARPQQAATRSRTIAILRGQDSNASAEDLLVKQLEQRGYQVSTCTIKDTPRPGQDVIALLDVGGPFFGKTFDAEKFEDVKAFVNNLSQGAGIFWITRTCQTGSTDPAYAPVIGLSRTLRSEKDIEFATCEVDDVENLPAAVVADVFSRFHSRRKDGVLDPDYEYAINRGATRVNRFFPFSLKEEAARTAGGKEFRMRLGKPGRLNTLQWTETTIAEELEEDEVEMEVHAVGLNFRDILIANGIIKLDDTVFGYEGAGIVRRIGSNVEGLQPGDRVLLQHWASWATSIVANQHLFVKIPDSLPFANAATMPMVYSTAIHGLLNKARLEAGQSVLIHSGCGALGIAAIQIAQSVGAEIFVTVSSQTKSEYLQSNFNIPAAHIFDSRSTSFVEGVMRETMGRGVDVALNSLSGELLHATWGCIAEWGTMVEVGKRDLLGMAKLDMSAFLANRTYACIDIDQMDRERPKSTAKLLRTMMDLHSQGQIKPIPICDTFEASRAPEAFSAMQQGTHIGKFVVQLRDPENGELLLGSNTKNAEVPFQLAHDGAYLVVGGLGGLGRSVAVWMAQHGARHFVFLSRKAGQGEHDADFVSELESMGCSVALVKGSVASPDEVSSAFDAAEKLASGGVKGVINMTMVLRDQAFDRMTFDDWATCAAPKVDGTWVLHEATVSRSAKLDFFLLFSSLSGIIGQPGQANYAAANTFLDAFVQFRQGQGLPCSAIDIGAMEGAGYLFDNEELLNKMKGTGWRSVSERELFDSLPLAMSASRTLDARDDAIVQGNTFLLGVAPTVPLSDPASSSRSRKDVRMAVYHCSGSSPSAGKDEDEFAAFLRSAKDNAALLNDASAIATVAHGIGAKLLALLLKPNDDVNISGSLVELGMDSLVAIEVKAWWKAAFGFDISVLEMLATGTLGALAKKAPRTLRSYSSFKPQPAPPKLSAEDQAEFERLQRAAAVAPAFQPSAADKPAAASSDATASAAPAEADLMHPNMFRGAPPEFEGDKNPKTGEIGGPKNEPLRWGSSGDWSYNGRATDF
ncbi:polyketide synthase [Stachybotrys elegans]|uniref:Polyketide synthase n=1 Tax=Stachybotrys elegans TaxID=80388 RepID=A0A8K0WKW8_9HYPO|nr:polyketide synthase [Stachybotrys elegans]